MVWMLFRIIPIFGGKMGMAVTLAPKGLGPQDPTKMLAYWADLLAQLLSQKTAFKHFIHGFRIVTL